MFTALCIPSMMMLAAAAFAADPNAPDPLHDIQDQYVATKDEKVQRAYHWGSQGPGDIFTNHGSHSNRLIPVYLFGKKADLGSVTGANSRYRTAEGVKAVFGRVPEHTVNPKAEYADQSDLYRVRKEAVARGAKYLFTIWFDGMDWNTIQAAAVAKTGKVYNEGPGSGLIFQKDASPAAPLQFGYVVTSPTHDGPKDARLDVNTQSVVDLNGLLHGGYDPRIAGPNPWTPGTLHAPGYFKGGSGDKRDKDGVAAVGGELHAYADSSCTAAEYASGVKSYNNGVNVAPDGRIVPTLFQQLQAQGWKVGTVTSVPFCHASPTAMYAHNVHRDDYQDLGREMLGLESVVQTTGKGPKLPGLDVVIGCGWGSKASASNLKRQGDNAVPGNTYITDADLHAIDARNGGKYVVAQRESGVNGAERLTAAAQTAADEHKRLFGFYGLPVTGHLPFRTHNGQFNPPKGRGGVAERYTPADLTENPTLAEMTRAALIAITGNAEKPKPFALFVESGDVDFALHDNNLDNAIGAVYSGEAAIRVIFDWIEQHHAWEESVVIATADHGHYLVVDDLQAIAKAAPAAAPAPVPAPLPAAASR